MAPNVTKKYKAAAVNAEPGWLDLELSVEKTIHWINEAGKNGCKLVAFPELCKFEQQSPSLLLATITSLGFLGISWYCLQLLTDNIGIPGKHPFLFKAWMLISNILS